MPCSRASQPVWVSSTRVPFEACVKVTETWVARAGSPPGCQVKVTRSGGSQAVTVPHTVVLPSEIVSTISPPTVPSIRTEAASARPTECVGSGHQLLNLASGGTLHQHLDGGEPHAGEEHVVRTHGATRTRDLLGARVRVRSGHHQGVRRVGARLRVTATSPDGLPEGIERTDRRFAVGVQWRPQTDPDAPGNRRLAEALVAAASRR